MPFSGRLGDPEVEAREAADAAADYVTYKVVWTFIFFLIGVIAAICCGVRGSRCRQKQVADVVAPV